MTPDVVDLSHHNRVSSLARVRKAGIRGVIHKATQGRSFVDSKFAGRREWAGETTDLLWGAYHFGTGDNVSAQVNHFLSVAKPDGKTLLALDYEPNPAGSTMTLSQARQFLKLVYEQVRQRPVLYSGHLLKQELKGKPDLFLAQHRLWLAQYGPKAVCPPGWGKYWLWQWTGDGIGMKPHTVDGVIDKGVDLNVFGGKNLKTEWAQKTQ